MTLFKYNTFPFSFPLKVIRCRMLAAHGMNVSFQCVALRDEFVCG